GGHPGERAQRSRNRRGGSSRCAGGRRWGGARQREALAGCRAVGFGVARGGFAVARQKIERRQALGDDSGASFVPPARQRGQQPGIGFAAAGVAILVEEFSVRVQRGDAVGLCLDGLGQGGAGASYLAGCLHFASLILSTVQSW